MVNTAAVVPKQDLKVILRGQDYNSLKQTPGGLEELAGAVAFEIMKEIKIPKTKLTIGSIFAVSSLFLDSSADVGVEYSILDGDESGFAHRKEENPIRFSSENQGLALNRKNKSFLISESEINSDRKRAKFDSVNRQEDIGLNFVGQLSDKIEVKCSKS